MKVLDMYNFSLMTLFVAWDQSDKYIKIYLSGLKNVQDLDKSETNFEKKFEPKSVYFRVLNLQKDRNFVFELKNLAYHIDPAKSEYRIKTGKRPFLCN